MNMPGRGFESDEHRFGFNGMEQDDEVKGAGNSLNFGARVYDARVGRWLSVDPLIRQYPFQSSFVGFNNNPISYKDPDGRSGVLVINKKKNRVTIKSDYFFTGNLTRGDAKKTASMIEDAWNNADQIEIDGEVYSLVHKVKGKKITQKKMRRKVDRFVHKLEETSIFSVKGTNLYRNNFALVGEYDSETLAQRPDVLRKGGNLFLIGDLKSLPHEHGHGLGWWDPDQVSPFDWLPVNRDEPAIIQENYELKYQQVDPRLNGFHDYIGINGFPGIMTVIEKAETYKETSLLLGLEPNENWIRNGWTYHASNASLEDIGKLSIVPLGPNSRLVSRVVGFKSPRKAFVDFYKELDALEKNKQ